MMFAETHLYRTIFQTEAVNKKLINGEILRRNDGLQDLALIISGRRQSANSRFQLQD
jgi:hypothetical protein